MPAKPKKSKKKNYIVRIDASVQVLVIGAENDEQAFEFARDEISRGDFEIFEQEIEARDLCKERTEMARRHMDRIAEAR